MKNNEYLVANPDTFQNPEIWTYRDLQKLCVKLSLGGKGSRAELLQKLEAWHRQRETDKSQRENGISMNVAGNNFSLLEINVRPTKCKRKRRSSIIDSSRKDIGSTVSPTLLRPLQRINCDTPSKSILKNISNYSENSKDIGTNKMAKLTFSPFNGVKLIENRYHLPMDFFSLIKYRIFDNYLYRISYLIGIFFFIIN